MDPLTIATAFADIISLIGQFKSESENRQSKTVDEYLEWLRRQNHQELVDLISDNRALTAAISPLLKGQHDEVMAKLHSLDTVLSSVASHLPDFHAIAVAVRPESAISEQAVSVLRQMNAAQASKFDEIPILSGPEFQMIDGAGGEIQFDDPRFVEDDLAMLCDLGLLRLSYTGKGNRVFTITRAGAKLAQ
jgi:hypothetical protein